MHHALISLLSTLMFSLGNVKYCVVTWNIFVGWFEALSDEILAYSKYDSLGLEFGIMIWNMWFICDTIFYYFRKN